MECALTSNSQLPTPNYPPGSPRSMALIGSNGMLATMLKQKIPASYVLHEFDLPDFDITNSEQVSTVIGDLRPDIIINCAAFTQVDLCESKQDVATVVNGVGPGYLADAAHEVGALLVHISTDFVFAGDKKIPYIEDDPTGPLSVYGRSKLEGEQAIVESPLERYYIVRTSWLYGPGGGNFVETIVRLATEREELGIVADQRGTPTYTGDLADAIVKLVANDELRVDKAVTGDELRVTSQNSSQVTSHMSLPMSHQSPVTEYPYGLYHFSNMGECSWYDFACEIVEQLRRRGFSLKAKRIKPIATEDYPVPAKRPKYSVLSKSKYMDVTGADVSEWKKSLQTYFDQRG